MQGADSNHGRARSMEIGQHEFEILSVLKINITVLHTVLHPPRARLDIYICPV